MSRSLSVHKFCIWDGKNGDTRVQPRVEFEETWRWCGMYIRLEEEAFQFSVRLKCNFVFCASSFAKFMMPAELSLARLQGRSGM